MQHKTRDCRMTARAGATSRQHQRRGGGLKIIGVAA